MLRTSRISLQVAACCGLLLMLASAPLAHAQSPSSSKPPLLLQLRIDGVSGEGSVPSVLGADAFPVSSFTVPVGRDEANTEIPVGSGPPIPEDIQFNMPVTGPAVQLWRLAVDGKVVPKASLAAFDLEGKIRYRIDLEQVVVRSFGLQTMGITRETVVGTLAYERIRLTSGEGKTATSASWERGSSK
jgi:hypothetical protein